MMGGRRLTADRRQAARAPKRAAVFSVPYAMCLLGWATIVGFHASWPPAAGTWERVPGDPDRRCFAAWLRADRGPT